jgi:hypothetical protein
VLPSTRDKSERLLASFEVVIATKLGPIRIDDAQIFRTKSGGHAMASLPTFCEKVARATHVPPDCFATCAARKRNPAACDDRVSRVAAGSYACPK